MLGEARKQGWRTLQKRDHLAWFAVEPKPAVLEGAFEVLDLGLHSGLAIRTSGTSSTDYVSGLAAIVSAAESMGWALVGLSYADDPEAGLREVVVTLFPVAGFVHARRTRDAMRKKRAEGSRLGRPRGLPDVVIVRILMAHWSGDSLRSIASELNSDRVPTAHGGTQWYASTVNAVLKSQAARDFNPGRR